MNIHEPRREVSNVEPRGGRTTNFSSKRGLETGPLPRIRLLLRRRYNNFLHRGEGEGGGGHQTGNGFISRFLRATSGVSDFTLKTLSFVVSLFRRDVRDFRYTRRRFPWKSMEYRRFKNFTILRIRGSRDGEWTSCFNAFDDCRVVRRERITRRRRVKPSPIVRHFIVSTWPRCVISRRNQADTPAV